MTDKNIHLTRIVRCLSRVGGTLGFRRKTQSTKAFILVLAFSLCGFTSANAQYTSTQYKFNESAILSGGEVDQTSGSYKSRAGVGETGIGNQTGTLFQANSGFETTDEEYLDVNLTGGLFDLGLMTSTTTKTFTTNFEVRAYISHGYSARVVGPAPQLVSSTPTGRSLSPMSTRGPSVQGTEQYGLNLRANTIPAIGSPIQQIPDATFSFGYATSDYDVVDQYKYVDGDVIARSDKSSGYTKYFMSFIANVAENTSGGEYSTAHTVVVTANY
jgi:hypothetical protein